MQCFLLVCCELFHRSADHVEIPNLDILRLAGVRGYDVVNSMCVFLLAVEIKVGSLIELGRDLECRGLQSFEHPWNGGRSKVSITPGMEGGPTVLITPSGGRWAITSTISQAPGMEGAPRVSIIPPWRVVGQAPEFNDVTAYIP